MIFLPLSDTKDVSLTVCQICINNEKSKGKSTDTVCISGEPIYTDNQTQLVYLTSERTCELAKKSDQVLRKQSSKNHLSIKWMPPEMSLKNQTQRM